MVVEKIIEIKNITEQYTVVKVKPYSLTISAQQYSHAIEPCCKYSYNSEQQISYLSGFFAHSYLVKFEVKSKSKGSNM